MHIQKKKSFLDLLMLIKVSNASREDFIPPKKGVNTMPK
jgi:hypothetical protein